MNIENKCNLKDVTECLVNEFKAQEITKEEFLNLDSNLSTVELNDNSIVYQINDPNFIQSLLSENEKSEIKIITEHLNENIDDIDSSSYEYKISTGKLIVIILESKDGDTFSSFTMDGNGEILFNHLSRFIGDDIEKNENPLDELIEDLKHFHPYGFSFRKYFK